MVEHTKKMVLIDSSELERLHNNKSTQPTTLNDLDHKMKRIIDMKNIDDNKKWILYNQVLQKYLKITSRSREPVTIPVIYPKENQQEQSERISQNILVSLPRPLQFKANALRNNLTHNGFSWNEIGNVIYDGNTIHGSNIFDLISDLMKSGSGKLNTEPAGWKNFAEILYKINVPRTLIVNSKRLKYMNEYQSGDRKELKEDVKVKPSSSFDSEEAEESQITKKSLRSSSRKQKRLRAQWSPYKSS
ncbi:hypothetical protein TcasGA2_TC010247 [Tribolium castaneum]|uniref:Uncharacterized protein n=1 Tax=Tribolium castaneum TaxID=7070 RepID=D7EJ95_TRICA|nr:hypothetical protein TcasGA2_TC010247 [Tribolium castaneum]